MSIISDMALWYASRSKVQLREASSHFAGYRYPECVACARALEYAGKRDCVCLEGDISSLSGN